MHGDGKQHAHARRRMFTVVLMAARRLAATVALQLSSPQFLGEFMPVNSLIRLALAAGTVVAVATAAMPASALPPPDQLKSVAGATAPVARLIDQINDARGAEADKHSLLSSCLAVDHEKVEIFFIGVTAAVQLGRLGYAMADHADMAKVDTLFGDDLTILKNRAKAVATLDASEPAECKALPFYAGNADTIKAAENAALAIIGLLSM